MKKWWQDYGIQKGFQHLLALPLGLALIGKTFQRFNKRKSHPVGFKINTKITIFPAKKSLIQNPKQN